MNMDLEIVKPDDCEFAIFAKFIFMCDSMNLINIYLIIILTELFDQNFYWYISSLILLKQYLMQ